MNIDGIILAAGLSSRMGQNKLLLPFCGKPILQHVIDLALSLPLASLTLVTRKESLAGIKTPPALRVVINSQPEKGQSLSMRLGLEAASAQGFLFFQGDQPLLDAATALAILALAGPDSIVVPVHAGAPGNPVFFAARFKNELMAIEGDQGGRSVRDKYAALCRYVEIASPAPMLDVDTPEKYELLLRGGHDVYLLAERNKN